MGILNNIGKLATAGKSFGTLDAKNPAPRAKVLTANDIHTKRSAERSRDLDRIGRKDKAAARAASALVYEVSAAGVEVKAKWTHRRNQFAELGQTFPDDEATLEAAENEQQRRDLAEATKDSATATARAANSSVWIEAKDKMVATATGSLTDYNANLKGVTDKTIAARRAELAADRAMAETAEKPLDEWYTEIDALVRTLAKPGVLRRGRHGGLRFDPPRELVSFGHSVSDALALISRYAPDALKEDMRAQARKIVGDAPTMTTAARREALARIDAESLALDHAEAELAWAAHEAGAPLQFRKGMPAKCILGVE